MVFINPYGSLPLSYSCGKSVFLSPTGTEMGNVLHTGFTEHSPQSLQLCLMHKQEETNKQVTLSCTGSDSGHYMNKLYFLMGDTV